MIKILKHGDKLKRTRKSGSRNVRIRTRGVLYQCDRRACDTCNPDCMLTSDIRHAKNFALNQLGVMQEVLR